MRRRRRRRTRSSSANIFSSLCVRRAWCVFDTSPGYIVKDWRVKYKEDRITDRLDNIQINRFKFRIRLQTFHIRIYQCTLICNMEMIKNKPLKIQIFEKKCIKSSPKIYQKCLCKTPKDDFYPKNVINCKMQLQL